MAGRQKKENRMEGKKGISRDSRMWRRARIVSEETLDLTLMRLL